MNEKIKEYLEAEFARFESEFQSLSGTPLLFKELYKDLKQLNRSELIDGFFEEIVTNCAEWWINPEKGIIKEEKLFAIIFEYDHDIFQKDVEATAYGINEWEDASIQLEDFDMGYHYDFATEFCSSPGITLKSFDPLEKLSSENLPDDLLQNDLCDYKGYLELTLMYKYFTYQLLHEALKRFSTTPEYKNINKQKTFQFFIDEHDTGTVTPLLIDEINAG